MTKRHLEMFIKRRESLKNSSFIAIKGTLIEKLPTGLVFSFYNPRVEKVEEGFIEKKNLEGMNELDIEEIFKPHSEHMLLLTSLRHQDYALLNYRAIHPEICEKPKKIIPTCGHYRGLFRMLKRHMDNYSHEKYINDNQACLDEILANEYTQQDSKPIRSKGKRNND